MDSFCNENKLESRPETNLQVIHRSGKSIQMKIDGSPENIESNGNPKPSKIQKLNPLTIECIGNDGFPVVKASPPSKRQSPDKTLGRNHKSS